LAFNRRDGVAYFDGVIVSHAQPMHFDVRLDDGRDIVAVLPKSTIRRLGCLIGSLADWRVVIIFPDSPKPPRIVDMSRPDLAASNDD
jgi:hypothetical protein